MSKKTPAFLQLNLREDHQAMASFIDEKSRVLDLGCGKGKFLEDIRNDKNCRIQGIDFNQQQVMHCIGKGIPVIQSDLETGLSAFDDNSFDYTVLGLTFQQIHDNSSLLHEMLRVGKYAIISIFNLGFWKNRAYFLRTGRMPKNENLPYEWYNTPNIHLGTYKDFLSMCQIEGVEVVACKKLGPGPDFLRELSPNMFAEEAVFLLRKSQ